MRARARAPSSRAAQAFDEYANETSVDEIFGNEITNLQGIGAIFQYGVFGAGVQLSWGVLLGLALFAGSMSFARSIDAVRVAPVIASVFGLAHGAGFAGPLLELKIAPGDLIWTLLTFNVGVELGQLTVVAAVVLSMWGLSRFRVEVPPLGLDVAASALFAVGTFWFVSRALV
jgi:hypothetical protein